MVAAFGGRRPLLAVFFFLFPTIHHALVLNLPSGRVKCLAEELRAGAMSVAHYRIADDQPQSHKISAQVSDPNGESVHQVESVELGQFAFVAAQTGRYTACFWSPRFVHSTSIDIDIDWKTGMAAKDWTLVAKKGKIDVMEIELKKLEDSVHSIHEEMTFLREREEEMLKLNEATNSRMGLLSLSSLLICLGIAGLQVWHLKAFFEREKIL